MVPFFLFAEEGPVGFGVGEREGTRLLAHQPRNGRHLLLLQLHKSTSHRLRLCLDSASKLWFNAIRAPHRCH